MPNIKRYRVETGFTDYSVDLEVDHDKLNADLARQINGFWSGDSDRLNEEDGDEVRAVIRFFGVGVIRHLLADGGNFFGQSRRDAGQIYSEEMREEEGWGGEDGTPFGYCGIRVIGADCETPDYDSVTLEERE